MSLDDSTPSPYDLLRRLENLLRPGTVQAVDHGGARLRVQSGDILTDWLPWFERRAGTSRTWFPPTVGEQCLLLCPGGELAAGMVLVGLYSDDIPSPSDSPDLHRVAYPDGACIEYDYQAHALVAELPAGGTASIGAPGGVTIDSPVTTITGSMHVSGDVVANGISLTGHRHGGVASGSSSTGTPS